MSSAMCFSALSTPVTCASLSNFVLKSLLAENRKLNTVGSAGLFGISAGSTIVGDVRGASDGFEATGSCETTWVGGDELSSTGAGLVEV